MLAPYSSPIVQRLSKALEKYGKHDVWIASFNEETDLNKKLLGLGKLDSYMDYLKFHKVNEIIKKINPDVVHAHIVNHYGLLAIFQKKPLLVALWGSDVMLAPNKGSVFRKKFFEFINLLVINRANMLHTSSEHILDEIVNKYGQNLRKKVKVFYWGFPVEAPSEFEYKKIELRFLKDCGIKKNDQLIISPRGVASIYNPEGVIKIVNKLSDIDSFKIVILRGFSTDTDVEKFNLNLGHLKDKIIFINRLLSSEELYYLYSLTKYHISIPVSDALGGGVVEPILRGSFPILSCIPPYQAFLKENRGYILEDYSDKSLAKLCLEIEHNNLKNTNSTLESRYSAESIVKRFSKLYESIFK